MRIVPVALALVFSCAALAGDGTAKRTSSSSSSKASKSKSKSKSKLPSKSKTPSTREPLDFEAAPKGEAAIAEAWQRLPKRGSACTDEDLGFDYGFEGGMRNFYCRAKIALSMKTLQSLAPTIFRKGPHFKFGMLDLHNHREFGSYDPAFVQWASDHLIPAADDATLRAATQGTYDAQVRTLARIYHLVDAVMSTDPAWIDNERRVYLSALDNTDKGGGQDNYALIEPYEDLLGTDGEPNVVRSATTWWLRRHHDGTAPLWRVGLHKLLATYDAEWLLAKKAPSPPLPRRAP